jgi:D-sedoheptulose 7-phosphate isomerase
VAAEFINRYRLDREPLPAIALTTDTSALTSIGNDSSFEEIFSRQVEALALKGDVLVGISTSGRSANVLRAMKAARARNATTVGFTGENGRGVLGGECDFCLVVPSTDTARIQEAHEFAWHVICGIVEKELHSGGRESQPSLMGAPGR